jgi:hypothetical protein
MLISKSRISLMFQSANRKFERKKSVSHPDPNWFASSNFLPN